MLRRVSKNKSWVIFGIVLGVLLASQVYAQAPGWSCRIHIRLNPYTFHKEDLEKLMWIEIKNREKESVPVYLHGEIEKDGKLVARANSPKLDIPKGGKRITRRDITKLSDEWWDKKLERMLLRAPMLPEGRYEACVYVYKWGTRELLTKCCISIVSKPKISPPKLRSPKDGAILTEKEKYPFFRWIPPTPLPPRTKAFYELKIVEVLAGQAEEEALRLNPPWFKKSGITATQFQYPAQARSLDLKKKYAWQVEASFEEGIPPIVSERWMFRPGQIRKMPDPVTVTSRWERKGTYFKVHLDVEVHRDISDLTITVWNTRFQCVPEDQLVEDFIEISAATWAGTRSRYFYRIPYCEAGESFTLSYDAVPILVVEEWKPYPGEKWKQLYLANWKLCDSAVVTCQEGNRYWLMRPDLLRSPAVEVHNAFRESDFLIVTCPVRLFLLYDDYEVDCLLWTMGQLAKAKHGVLGILDQYGTLNHELRSLLYPSGAWGKRLCPGWGTIGIISPLVGGASHDVLIVGEQNIVPSWTISNLNIPWSNAPPTTQVRVTDFPYSDCDDDHIPELVVGRIIGRNPKDLMRPLEGALKSHPPPKSACLVSGIDTKTPRIQSYFIDGVDDGHKYLTDNFKFSVASIHMSKVPSGQRLDTLQKYVHGKEIIAYNGHGNSNAWGGVLGAGQVGALNYGGATPLVVAFACLTGYYPDNNAICRAFLRRWGTEGYIGSTEGSAVYVNCELTEEFFWKASKWGNWSPARALAAVRWSYCHESSDYKKLAAWEYNFYGCPR